MAVCVAPATVAGVPGVLQAQEGVTPLDSGCIAVVMSPSEYGSAMVWHNMSASQVNALAGAAITLLAVAAAARMLLRMVPTR